jgi:hypothetical protein
LGTNLATVNWPTCGEIDVMENIGKASEQGIAHTHQYFLQYTHPYANGKFDRYFYPHGDQFSYPECHPNPNGISDEHL